jgi:hypothetical protein
LRLRPLLSTKEKLNDLSKMPPDQHAGRGNASADGLALYWEAAEAA